MKQAPFIIATASYSENEVGIIQHFPLAHSFSRLLPSMKTDEPYSLVSTNFSASYLPQRPTLLHTLRTMSRKTKLSPRTLYLSIAYMDEVLGKVNVKEEGLGLIAVCCLYIAEVKDRIPLIEDVQRLAGGQWSLSEIKKCELRILAAVGFRLKSLTVYDFACSFLYHFMCESEICFDELRFEQALASIERLVDSVYSDYWMHTWKMSLVAAGCIFCYRKNLRISPVWLDTFEHITGYKEEEVELIAEKIWSRMEWKEEKKAVLEPNSGITNGAKNKGNELDKEDGKQKENIKVKRPLNVYELYMNC